jgi:uncharacterized protein
MIAMIPAGQERSRLSDAAKERMLSVRGEPLFLAGWERALFLHYEVEATVLQRELPFELDLWNGKAFVSLVAFTMRDMRLRVGGRVGAWLCKPVATHSFLNVRTYVRHRGEAGICFLSEWLSSWLSVQLGPRLYGLPYRYAKIRYDHVHEQKQLSGKVESLNGGQFVYEARMDGDRFKPCEAGSLDEFLVERYTAFNCGGRRRLFFRIWHPPWMQTTAEVSVRENSLLTKTWRWFKDATFAGANYSPGFRDVWMGRAQDCRAILTTDGHG